MHRPAGGIVAPDGRSHPFTTPAVKGPVRKRRPERYAGPIATPNARPHAALMTAKRILAAFLWFYAGWYAGATIAYFLGLSEALGPIVGTAAAALIAGDPRGIIWTVRSERIERRIAALSAQTA